MRMNVARIVDSLGLKGRKSLRTYNDLEDLIESGRMTPSAVDHLAGVLDIGVEELMSRASYYKAKERRRLSAPQALRLERSARLYGEAEELFGSPDAARRFMQTPHPELGGRSPLQRAATELGAREVEELLGRIEYGLPV